MTSERTASYLAECYLPRGRRAELADLIERARAACEALTTEGTPVRHLRSTFLPEDEVCLHFFEGPSSAAVALALQRADIRAERIGEALDGYPEDHRMAGGG